MARLSKDIKHSIPITTKELALKLLNEYYRNQYFIRNLEKIGITTESFNSKLSGLILQVLEKNNDEFGYDILEEGVKEILKNNLNDLESKLDITSNWIYLKLTNYT
jgi:hypothetical protein